MRRLSGLACPSFSCSDQSAAKASAAATGGRSSDDQSAAMACVDDMLTRLLRCKPGGKGKDLNAGLTESELILLCRESREEFLRHPMLLSVPVPVKICGDTHGQFGDLLSLLELGGRPPDTRYVFLGDCASPGRAEPSRASGARRLYPLAPAPAVSFTARARARPRRLLSSISSVRTRADVDRGLQSIETVGLLMALRLKYPASVFLLRGNHECASINRMYGFFDECKRRYSVKLYKAFINAFNCMPAAAVVGEKVFCCHGGLSPEMDKVKQVLAIKRPSEVPEKGLLCDLLWSDPAPDMSGWRANDRGVSYCFGADVIHRFLDANDLDLVVRAHQVFRARFSCAPLRARSRRLSRHRSSRTATSSSAIVRS